MGHMQYVKVPPKQAKVQVPKPHWEKGHQAAPKSAA